MKKPLSSLLSPNEQQAVARFLELLQHSHAISTLGAGVSLEYDVLIGPRVIGQERWERMKQRRFGLYRNIVAEGIPLTSARTHS